MQCILVKKRRDRLEKWICDPDIFIDPHEDAEFVNTKKKKFEWLFITLQNIECSCKFNTGKLIMLLDVIKTLHIVES